MFYHLPEKERMHAQMFYHLLQKERMHALVCYYQSMFIHLCRTNTDVVFVGVKRKRCGECAGCTSPECGSCRFCLDMTKFGGPGKKKKPCYQWKCSKMQIRQSTETRIAKQLRQTTTSKLKVTKTPLGEIQNQNHGKNKS